MQATRYYASKTLKPGEFKEAFERAAAATAGPEVEITAKHYHRSDGRTDEFTLGAESLHSLVDLSKSEVTLIVSKPKDVSREITVYCDYFHSTFVMSAADEPSLRCMEQFGLILGLERTERPKNSVDRSLEEIHSRLVVLENAIMRDRRLKCFISFRFDDTQTSIQVERLKRFLAVMRIEWVTGEQFEPRRIEDKVKARLRADVDFIVAIISKAGESKWLRDELADANARGLPLVVLLENGATFDKGIFGTLEYILYDLAIDQTFLQLAEGVNFIRAALNDK
ncbi:MAG: hypothetical protein JWO19_581 [Bryobacterales bacterium]|nr:hypothetical protein [Bryobacterales bacterium]